MSLARSLPLPALSVCLALLSAACGSPPPPAAPTSDAVPTSSAAPTPPVAEAPKEAEKPASEKPSEPEKPATKTPPASKTTINGVSISTLTEKDVAPLLEKAGWKVEPGGMQPPQKFGKHETFSVVAYKGAKLDKNVKSAFYFGFARQTATPDPKTVASEENFAPKKLKEMYVGSNPKLIYVFDEAADVLVTISPLAKGTKDAELQKIFDQTVVKAK